MKKKQIILKFTAILAAVAAIIALLTVLALFVYSRVGIDYESDKALFDRSLRWSSTAFYALDSDGKYSNVDYSGSIKKCYVSIDEICRYIKDGFIAVEDRNFYDHKGWDVKRTVAAAVNYLTKKQPRFGASTITQQVIKNISGDNEPTLVRKFNEILRSVNVEKYYTKDEILEVYLNVIPMGENIFGVEMASRAYFGKSTDELSCAQAATLIGITNAPTAYNPYKNPQSCRNKRDFVLSVMKENGVINELEYNAAVSSELGVIPMENREDKTDSWFVETVITDASSDLAKKLNVSQSAARVMLLGGGYSVYTTMDHAVQNQLESFFEDTRNFSNALRAGLQYAMVVVDSKTAEVKGIVGSAGKKQADRIMNHATVPHVPASVLKPLALYAPLIDSGKINWATVFDDVPLSFNKTENGYSPYPLNSPNLYSGLITVNEALKYSKNTVAVRLCNMIGADKVFYDLKNNFGFSTLLNEGKNSSGSYITDKATSPMALGQLSYGLPLTELTAAYTVFPSNGIYGGCATYRYILDSDGNTVIEKHNVKKRIFARSTAEIMNQMLIGVVREGTAKEITLDKFFPTAGKTGTSSGARDKLFVGYTPYYTAGIWCGFPDNSGSVAGFSPSHLEIWDKVMIKLHENIPQGRAKEQFSVEGLTYRPYCRDSGMLYADNCRFDPRGNREDYGYFTPDNAPYDFCDTHLLCDYDAVEKGVACADCPAENLVKVALLHIDGRSFPTEVYVTDAEFVYKAVDIYGRFPQRDDLPYFYCQLPEGSYSGISKRKKQFNCACPHHE